MLFAGSSGSYWTGRALTQAFHEIASRATILDRLASVMDTSKKSASILRVELHHSEIWLFEKGVLVPAMTPG